MTALRTHAFGLLATSGTLAIWTVLAVRSPDLTYHFAPLIAAGLWPGVTRRGDVPTIRMSVVAALGAFFLVMVVSLILAAGGYLEGPTFWNAGPALTEAILFAALGAGLGTLIARRPAPAAADRPVETPQANRQPPLGQ